MPERFTVLLPMNGHSERAPFKNIRPLASRPLWLWILAVLAAYLKARPEHDSLFTVTAQRHDKIYAKGAIVNYVYIVASEARSFKENRHYPIHICFRK